MTSRATVSPAALGDRLAAVVGGEHVLRELQQRTLYATDIYVEGAVPDLVVRPGTTEELALAVRLATTHGYAVTPRGGGMSYTGGYTATRTQTVMLDLLRLNRIVEINRQDMYVTVETGVTWAQLHEALQGTGLRTPMWGTLSGLKATIGGGMSQGALFFGTGQHGITADMVLSLQVVLADGSTIRTGSAAVPHAKPFFRWYGPDLTGLFLGDSGSLGVKATVTLKLVPVPAEQRFASFAFDGSAASHDAMSAIARSGVASECMGFDPPLQQQRLRRASLSQDLRALKGVVTGQGGLMKGIAEAARIAVAGRRFMDDVLWSVHAVVEADDGDSARRRLETVQRICREFGGRALENTIPKVTRAMPFNPLVSMLGPDGERWVPVHGLVALGDANRMQAALDSLWERNRTELDRLQIVVGHLTCTVAANAFLIEPVFWWPGARLPLHDHALGPEYVARLQQFADAPLASSLVQRLRLEAAGHFREHGAVHLQIGKTYPYQEGLHPRSFGIVESIKGLLDPDGLMNPGALGMQSGAPAGT